MLHQLHREDAPTGSSVAVVNLSSVLSPDFALNEPTGNVGKGLT